MAQTTLDSKGQPLSYRHVILSFRGPFAYLIYNGVKKYEIRKSNMTLVTLRQSIAYIYEVKPVGAVTGFFYIKNITRTLPHLAIAYFDFDLDTRRYIANLETNKSIYMITIGECVKFDKPVRINHPPRSWRYLTNEEKVLLIPLKEVSKK
jgi:predicted transcriptional regulator